MVAQTHKKTGMTAPHIIIKMGQKDMHVIHKIGLYTQSIMQHNGKIIQQQHVKQHT